MTQGDRCTVQLRSGKFCDAPRGDDMPHPICMRHALDVYRAISGLMKPERIRDTLTKYGAAESPAVDPEAGAVVYYIAWGDGLVKIGYTTNMRKRLSTFSALPSQVLATEPGGSTLEARRHREFAADRVDPSRELFRPSARLTEHIAQVRADHPALNARRAVV